MATGLSVSKARDAAVATPLVGVVDIGSNSVRLVIFEDGVRSPDYFFNEKTICQLGADLGATGRLSEDGKTRALAALTRYAALAENMGVAETIAIGTAALREAEDGPEFREEITARTGLKVRVVSGREEATLAAEGVLLGWPSFEGVVADLGGSSLELAKVKGGKVDHAISSPSGHLRLTDIASPEARRAMMALSAAAGPFAQDGGRLILVGGAWRALAKAHMAREGYPFLVLQGYELSCEAARDLCEWAVAASPSDLKKMAEVSSSRLTSVAAGAHALLRLLEDIRPAEVAISAFGVREGVAHERMSKATREDEPLISAARRAETRNARCPGFGDELFDWMAPLIADFDEETRRLTHATCLMHDVNWRAHPDYRAAACFGAVTRANLGGVGHKGRLFMGAALVHRYKGSSQDREATEAIARLPDHLRAKAEIVGRAARLGAMLSGSIIGTLDHCGLTVEDGALILTYDNGAGVFAGERVERRLNALADRLGLAGEIRF
ncbi:MAG: Ppx/GppA family phosphatase [Pseudomonadota bacterium]